MDPDFHGRIFQDYRFEIDYLRGYRVEECIGLLLDDEDMSPVQIALKLTDLPWQIFFLDIGIGFWEQWLDETRVFQDYEHVDYATLFNIRGAEIISIICQPVEEGLTTRLYIQFSTGTLIWRYINEQDLESDQFISFEAETA